MLAAVLGMVGLLRRSGIIMVGAAVLLLCTTPLSPLGAAGDTTAAGNASVMILLGATFLVGALMFPLRGRPRLSWWVLAGLALLWIATWDTRWSNLTGVLVTSLAVLVLAFRTPAALRRLTGPGRRLVRHLRVRLSRPAVGRPRLGAGPGALDHARHRVPNHL